MRISSLSLEIQAYSPKWTGTNTYLVGQRNPYFLVDTGEGLESYIPILDDAIKNHTTDFRPEEADVSDIILTHRHFDHCGGLPTVLALLRRRWKDRNGTKPFPAPRIHKFPLSHPQSDAVFHSLPAGSFMPSQTGSVSHDLHESQTFKITASEPSPADEKDLILEIVHTPGHTPDSVCIYFPADHVLFTGDTILGHGSTVFEDLATYMGSLRKMIAFKAGDAGDLKYTTLNPGHGPTVPHDHVEMYLRHRVDRENQVLKVLATEIPEGKHWTTWTIVETIYKDFPRDLLDAAAHSAGLHLKKLETEGRVEQVGGRGHHIEWEFHG